MDCGSEQWVVDREGWIMGRKEWIRDRKRSIADGQRWSSSSVQKTSIRDFQTQATITDKKELAK